ncbi:LuxR C-terminal-related transcriptional regulator [Streptomyces sp. NPDC051554]|uniref:helix-turn-helix transcriptional regulator n=1 Tax=Streptomyces sp. NPDC051554 TaxID=3365656 RepID=UPI00379F8C11
MTTGFTPHGHLTPAQTAVIAGYARGYTTLKVEERLGLSERAIRHHIERAARRADVTGRPLPGLVNYAYLHDLFSGISRLAIRTRTPPPHRQLARSQQAVLECMALGMSTNATARHLGIGRETTRAYRRGLYRRIGTTSPPHAVALGWQWGLLSHTGQAAVL